MARQDNGDDLQTTPREPLLAGVSSAAAAPHVAETAPAAPPGHDVPTARVR